MIDKNIIENFAIVMGAIVGFHKNTKEVAIKMKEGSAKDKTILRQKIVYSIFFDFIPDSLLRMHSMQSALNFRANAENMLLHSPEVILANIAFQENFMRSINVFAKIQSFVILQELLRDVVTIKKISYKMNITSQTWLEKYFSSDSLQEILINDYKIFVSNILDFLKLLISINIVTVDDYNNVVKFVNNISTDNDKYKLMLQIIKNTIQLFLHDLRISKYFNINIQTLSDYAVLKVSDLIDLDVDFAPLEIKISGINYTKKHYDYVCATINSLKHHKNTILYLAVSRQPITSLETDMICNLYGLIHAHNLDSKIFDAHDRNLFIFGPHYPKELNIVVHEYLADTASDRLIERIREDSDITSINFIGLADDNTEHLNLVQKLYPVIRDKSLINISAYFITRVDNNACSDIRFWLRPSKNLKPNEPRPYAGSLAKNISICQDLTDLLDYLQQFSQQKIDDFMFMYSLHNKALYTISNTARDNITDKERENSANNRSVIKM